MKKSPVLASVALMLVAISGAVMLGQGNATLSGEVKDAAGKAVGGVLVKAKIGGMTVTVPSKLGGRFTITGLRPGTYEVRAEHRGFLAPPQQVTVPAAGPLSFTLQPGPVDRYNLSTGDLEKVLPDSPYKQTLLGCEICHSWTGLAAQKQYRQQTWVYGMRLMIDQGISRIRADDVPAMAEYLQANFGPNAKLPVHLLPPDPIDEGSLNIRYVSFDIPTPNAMPHTAVPDGKGNVWFAEYGGKKIGVVNVKTGQMEEFRVTEHDFPGAHGLTLDRFGNVWFTEQRAGKIGRFDPRTKTFKHYQIPRAKNPAKPSAGAVAASEGASLSARPAAAAPHTLIADPEGNIWFTAGSDPIRKLNVQTGEFTEYVIREGGGQLYGVTRDPRSGRIWYAGIGINEVGYIDPATGKVTRFAMLTPDAGPRRLHIDSKGVAWFNLYNVSKIGRADPATGKVSEWNLPGSRRGRPYPLGIDSKDRVWTQTYDDDLLYMFDPKTERVTTYVMPNKGNGLRDFYEDEEGTIWAGVWGRNQVIGFKLEDQ